MYQKVFSFLSQLVFSKTAKNVYWTFIGNGFYTFFTFVFTVLILARQLGPEQFGRFSALFVFIQLLSEFSDLGIGPSLSRFIPPLARIGKSREITSITRASFQFEIILAVLFTIFVLIFAPFLSIWLFDGTSSLLVRLSGFGILGIVLFLFVHFALSSREKFRDVAFLNITLSTSRVVLALLFLFIDRLNLLTALISMFLPTLFTWMFSTFFLSPQYLSFKIEKKTIRKIFSFSKYIGFNKVFSALTSRADVLMLSALTGSFSVGIYSAALRITQIYPLITGSLLAVLAPRFSVYNTLKESADFTKKVFFLTILMISSIGILFLISRPFILLIFGQEYESSIPVFQALLLPMIFFILQIPFTGLVVYTLKKPSVFAFGAFIQLVLVLVGNIIFIPRFGVFGPVFGLSFGYLGALITLVLGVWYYRNGNYENRN